MICVVRFIVILVVHKCCCCAIFSNLKGEGLKVLDDLLPHKLSEWDKVQATLRQRFGEPAHSDGASGELASRRRGEVEWLGAFLADLQRLACRAYPDFSAAVQEELTLCAFIRRLGHACLREHVRLAAPHSLSAALDTAETAEVFPGTATPPPGPARE